MKRNLLYVFIVCVLLAAGSAALASSSSSMAGSPSDMPDMPLYPGATVKVELNLRDDDVLQLVRQAISGLVTATERKDEDQGQRPIGALVREFDLQGLSEIIGGLRQVTVVVATLPRRKSDAKRVLDFYDRKLAEEGWNRIVYAIPGDGGAAMVRALPSAEGFFVVGINPKNPRELFMARTLGFVDIQKTVVWLANAAEAAGRHKKPDRQDKGQDVSPPENLPVEGE